MSPKQLLEVMGPVNLSDGNTERSQPEQPRVTTADPARNRDAALIGGPNLVQDSFGVEYHQPSAQGFDVSDAR